MPYHEKKLISCLGIFQICFDSSQPILECFRNIFPSAPIQFQDHSWGVRLPQKLPEEPAARDADWLGEPTALEPNETTPLSLGPLFLATSPEPGVPDQEDQELEPLESSAKENLVREFAPLMETEVEEPRQRSVVIDRDETSEDDEDWMKPLQDRLRNSRKPLNHQQTSPEVAPASKTQDQSSLHDMSEAESDDSDWMKPLEGRMKNPKKPDGATAKKPVDAAAKHPVKVATKKPVKTASKKPVKAASKKPVKAAAKKPVKAAAKKTVKAAAKKPSEPAIDKPEEVGPESLKIQEEPVEVCPEETAEIASSKPEEIVIKRPKRAAAQKPQVPAAVPRPKKAATKSKKEPTAQKPAETVFKLQDATTKVPAKSVANVPRLSSIYDLREESSDDDEEDWLKFRERERLRKQQREANLRQLPRSDSAVVRTPVETQLLVVPDAPKRARPQRGAKRIGQESDVDVSTPLSKKMKQV